MKGIGRNAPCPCGSGKKYKHCCLNKKSLFASQARGRSARPEPAASSDLRKGIFLALGIALAAFLAYSNSFGGGFVFDDHRSVVDNLRIRSLWPISPIFVGTNRPVLDFTFAVNYAIGGLDPWGYHAVNWVIHLVAALLLFGILCKTLSRVGLRPGGLSPELASFSVSLLWVVHPIHTQAVTYISQRAESLMSLFYLLVLYFVIRGEGSRFPNRWYIASILTCAAGMGTKAIMATAPVAILLYDRIFLEGSFKEIAKKRGWLYLGLASTWVLLVLLLLSLPPEAYETHAGFGLRDQSAWDYALTQPGVMLHYLRLIAWPTPLLFDYLFWPVAQSLREALPSLLILLSMMGATAWLLRKSPRAGFLGAWFFLLLLPSSSFIPVADVAFEYRVYLASASMIAAGVLGISSVSPFLISSRFLRGIVGAVGLGGLTLLLGFLTFQRNQDYQSELSLWADEVSKVPQNPRAHNNLGYELAALGRFDEALSHYEKAVELFPRYVDAYTNWANALSKQGRSKEAAQKARRALELDSASELGHLNLADALFDLGHPEEAIAHYKEALQRNPRLLSAYNNYGNTLVSLGRPEEAIGLYQKALEIHPEDHEVHVNLGTALSRTGREEEALFHFRKALALRPDFPEAHYTLGAFLLQKGNAEKALEEFQEAIRLKPNFAEGYTGLGLALEKQGDLEAAIAAYEEALRLKPDLAQARERLAAIRVSR